MLPSSLGRKGGWPMHTRTNIKDEREVKEWTKKISHKNPLGLKDDKQGNSLHQHVCVCL